MRDEEQARNTSRALLGSEKESRKEARKSGVRQNLNPFNGDKSPSARTLPPPPRRAGRQFVRVYPTYPDISTLRPGGGLGSQSSADLSLAFSYSTLPSLLPNLHPTHLLFDFSFIFSLPFIHFYPRFRLGSSCSPRFSTLLFSIVPLLFSLSILCSIFHHILFLFGLYCAHSYST